MAQPAGDDRMSASLDPVTVELIGSALASITDEMCEALVRASHSTNVKERRDCTTALFDADGRSLCEAEQIPMLLGSFIDMVPQILKRYPREEIRPGDVFVGNDPYVGGSTHLPEIARGLDVEGHGAPADAQLRGPRMRGPLPSSLPPRKPA